MSTDTIPSINKAKRAAATAAVNDHVCDKMVIGIGSGSTVVYVVERLAERVRDEHLQIICVPTSYQSRWLIINNELCLSDLDRHPEIDITFDGADEVDENFDLIKGGGGCCTQEKIVAANSKRLIIVADLTKDSRVLGDQWKGGVPIEVIPLAHVPVMKKLRDLGGIPKLRQALARAGPVVTDNFGFIVDVDFGPITDPASLEKSLRKVVGIVESGLFVGMASEAYFGNMDGSYYRRVARVSCNQRKEK